MKMFCNSTSVTWLNLYFISEDNISLYTIRKYSRMTRDYQRLYMRRKVIVSEAVKQVQQFKSHRTILFSKYQNLGEKFKPWHKNKEVGAKWKKEKLAEEELLLCDGLQPSSAALAHLDSEIDSDQEDSEYELQDSDDDYRVSEDDG